VSGKLPDEEPDQVRQSPIRKLDGFELRRNTVDLGRPPRPGPASAAGALETDVEESGFRESIEAASGDVAMNPECRSSLVGGERVPSRARVEKDPAKLAIASRREPVERHGVER
jgi:hypothetical protein